MTIKFGVKSVDIEEAHVWVVEATALGAEARESSDWGGNYYSFEGPAGERLRMLNNKDVYDNEPVVGGCDSWEVVLIVENTTGDSKIVQSLESDKAHFSRIK